jgi:hypothetical protein
MNNTTLPAEVQEQIKADARKYCGSPCCRITFMAGATAYAPWKVKHDQLREENETLKQLFKDLHHYCNQQGIYSAVIQDMIAKALAEKGGEK